MTKVLIQVDKAAIVGQYYRFDNLKIEVDGPKSEVIAMLMKAVDEDADLLSWFNSVIVMHYHRKGKLDEWMRHMKIGVALLTDDMPPNPG